MSEWKAKRFWKDAQVREDPDGFGISLDGRPVRTPAKRVLLTPTRAFAEAVEQEWAVQEDAIDPSSMPFTRSANAAVDKVAIQHSEVADLIAAYGDSDLLCYRAEHPAALVTRQTEQWGLFLDWAEQTFGARLEARAGVIHIPQEPDALSILTERVHAMTPFELTGFHDLVSLSGSLILGLATTCDFMTPKAIWDISRLDEIWQAEQWGADDDAEAVARIKEAAFCHAKQVFDISGV